MDKKFAIGGIGLVVVLLLALGLMVWQKSQVRPATEPAKQESAIKKVDMATQPDWVQKLQVTTKRGVSPNTLQNVTFTVSGLPSGLVQSLDYILQYQTANKGSQGAMSTKPINIGGKTEYSKLVEFGSCSTKTCVHFDGVTAIDLELDFTTTASEKFSWSKSLTLTN